MNKIYIANRGEIRRRIAETAKRLGLQTACIRDRNQPIEQNLIGLIDQYILVDNESTSLYLDGEKQLEFAQAAGCDAIHPGFGFLSENVAFAEQVIKTGLTWIGPSPKCIDQMADKSSASLIADKAGVPVLPVFRGFNSEDKDSMVKLKQFVSEHKFPFIIKAALGGGGKGMRVVYAPEELESNIKRASSEALNAFGDGTVIVEKYLESPRHVETQLVADKHGNYIVYGDRDCSSQRRYQKVIEECPAPNIYPKLRESMHQTSISLAKKIGYDSVGTIEFLIHGEGAEQKYYFLEMNTRLQVEHPVTEEVFQIDLVEKQIRSAMNEKLLEHEAKPYGHSFEARIYAEDPNQKFIPQPGLIEYFRPYRARGVRWETALNTCDFISPSYDPMIAKVIVWGVDRKTALDKLAHALNHTILFGVKSNKQFLVNLLNLGAFKDGVLSTHIIEQNIGELTKKTMPFKNGIYVEPVEIKSDNMNIILKNFQGNIDHNNSDHIKSAFYEKKLLQVDSSNNSLVVVREKRNIFQNNEILAQVYLGELISSVKSNLFVMVEHKNYIKITIETEQNNFECWQKKKLSRAKRSSNSTFAGSGTISPVPGVVRAIEITEGQSVTEGQILFIIESMKMEFEVKSNSASKIKKILVAVGDQVGADELLVHFDK